MQYNTEYLIESLDSLIESAKYKLSAQELDLLHTIRNNIAKSKSEKEVEQWFFELVGWLMLIKEYLENIT